MAHLKQKTKPAKKNTPQRTRRKGPQTVIVSNESTEQAHPYRVFISYSHENTELATAVI